MASQATEDDAVAVAEAQELSCVAMGLRSIHPVPDLRSHSDVTRLCLHANQLSSLEGLHALTALRELVVSCNPLPAVGQSLSALANLRVFDATSCRLQTADGFGTLTNLQQLVRHNSCMADVPQTCCLADCSRNTTSQLAL